MSSVDSTREPHEACEPILGVSLVSTRHEAVVAHEPFLVTTRARGVDRPRQTSWRALAITVSRSCNRHTIRPSSLPPHVLVGEARHTPVSCRRGEQHTVASWSTRRPDTSIFDVQAALKRSAAYEMSSSGTVSFADGPSRVSAPRGSRGDGVRPSSEVACCVAVPASKSVFPSSVRF